MVWMVGIFRSAVFSSGDRERGGARWNRHGHRRRFSFCPRRAPFAPRTHVGSPVVVRGHPRRQRATAPRMRRNRQDHPTGGFPASVITRGALGMDGKRPFDFCRLDGDSSVARRTPNRKKNIDGRLCFCETCSSSVSRGAGTPRFKTLSRIRMGIVFLQA